MACTGTPSNILNAAQVLGLIEKTGQNKGTSSKSHYYSDAVLIMAGVPVTSIAKLKAATASPGVTNTTVLISDGAMMTQIAYEESGFIPNCHGVGPRDDSYGLWQINMLGPLGPANRKLFNLSKNDDLYDPHTNARVAYEMIKTVAGVGNAPAPVAFDPWNGSWQKALRHFADGTSQIKIGAGGEHSVDPGTGSTDTQIPDVRGAISAASSVLDVLKAFFGIIVDPTFWRRLGVGVLGFLIIVGALIVWNKDAIIDTGKKVVAA